MLELNLWFSAYTEAFSPALSQFQIFLCGVALIFYWGTGVGGVDWHGVCEFVFVWVIGIIVGSLSWKGYDYVILASLQFVAMPLSQPT